MLVYTSLFSDNDVCSAHAINGGQQPVTVAGSVATLQFEGTGPSEFNTVQDFTCRLDEIVNGGFEAVTESELCTAIPGMLQNPLAYYS